MGRRNLYFFIVLLLIFFSCSNKHSTKKSGAKDDIPVFYKKNDFPISRLNAHVGDYVLVPPSEFIEKYKLDNDTMNFLAFYPRKLLKIGKYQSVVEELDTQVVVPNTLIIPLPKHVKAKKGDLVLTWWQGGTGMQRAYVIDDKEPLRPVVRFLDMEWFGTKDLKGEYQLDSNTFRLIEKPLDPGSSVAYPIGIGYEFYIVLNVVGDTIVGLNWSNQVKLLDRRKVLPNNPKPKIEEGQRVWAPVFGIYTQVIVQEIKQGLSTVEVNILGEKIIRKVPVMDLRVKLD